MLIEKKSISNDVSVVWATPLSGYAHTADEQPMPYLHCPNGELTPRFGGEEADARSNKASLPLPFGTLMGGWPMCQRIYNLPRRNLNIYWRNLFKSRTVKDEKFYFIEQLDFRKCDSGFHGESPLLNFSRTFTLSIDSVRVSDRIIFKRQVSFSDIHLCTWAMFEQEPSGVRCEITPSLPANYIVPIQSSTGAAKLLAHRIENITMERGQDISWHCVYKVVG
jgi:hypothetical protein